MISQEQIDDILKRVIQGIQPKKVILFGSYANGTANKDSDLDLLIVKNTTVPRYKRALQVRRHLRGLKIPIDLLVYTEDEIAKWGDVKSSFICQVMQEGKVLYKQ